MFKSKPIEDPFKSSLSIVQLQKIDPYECQEFNTSLLCSGEAVLLAFKGVRAHVLFTQSRLLVIKIKGLSGNDKCIMNIPYEHICTYAITTQDVHLQGLMTMHVKIQQYDHPLTLQFEPNEGLAFIIDILSNHPTHQ